MNSAESGYRPLIAHLITQLAVGGVEKGVVTLINRMPPDRYRHAVIAMTSIEDFSRNIQQPGVELVGLGKRPGKDLMVFERLRRTLRRLRPDILHSRNLGTLDAQWTAFVSGVPVRIHGENGRDTYDLDGTNFKYNLLRRAVRPFIHRYSAVSQDLANWLIRTIHVKPDLVHQIYNGVDTGKYHPRAGVRAVLPFPAGTPEDCFVVGTVGRMAAVKDQLTLVQAFLELTGARPELRRNLRLLIVGDGEMRRICGERLEAGGAGGLAWLPGERSDVAELMRAMDLFVLPSLGEGISNTILEAMACGLPVAATRVGGNPELVLEGKTGDLFPVSDRSALAAVIARYYDDPAMTRARGTAARLEVEARFTLDAMVQAYCDLYDGALGATRRAGAARRA
jgi:sugar transferase (PEP-CTERM/EpsH1 system associated)